jgi:hypothetical protein
MIKRFTKKNFKKFLGQNKSKKFNKWNWNNCPGAQFARFLDPENNWQCIVAGLYSHTALQTEKTPMWFRKAFDNFPQEGTGAQILKTLK